MNKRNPKIILPVLFCLLFGACSGSQREAGKNTPDATDHALTETSSLEATSDRESGASELTAESTAASVDEAPDYFGEPYIVLGDNMPDFAEEDKTLEAFEYYSELDSLGRCQTAYANICRELMPTEEREAIGMVKPSGWQTKKYEFVDGKYLYNRCHLIGFQLAAENANEKNLITGTRYMNVDGMLPFENQVADYVKETDGHVLYRVTPVFFGENLLASGVEMEAFSVEDGGEEICFHVYVYNVQPGVEINYATGESRPAAEGPYESADNKNLNHEEPNFKEQEDPKSSEPENDVTAENNAAEQTAEYILNTNTKKFHLPSCKSADEIKPQNRASYTGGRSEITEQGYSPCQRCNP